MNNKNIIFKGYDRNLKNSILNLFKKTFGKNLSLSMWNWRFEQNPFGPPKIKLAFINESLIGNYLVHPVKLLFGETKFNSLFSMSTMTHPNYSGKGIGTTLASNVYEEGKKENFDFVFGFANDNSRHMFTKKLGFKELFRMQEIIINSNLKIQNNKKYHVKKINHFDHESSIFFSKQCEKLSSIVISRNEQYLNWRYIHHPEINYHCFLLYKNNNLLGYFVLKNYDQKKCHIVDFIIDDTFETFEFMLYNAIKFAKENNIPEVTFWNNVKIKNNNFLKNIEHTIEPMNNYFIVKLLRETISDEIQNSDNWYLCMGDSDVF